MTNKQKLTFAITGGDGAGQAGEGGGGGGD